MKNSCFSPLVKLFSYGLLVLTLSFASCKAPRDIAYFQNADANESIKSIDVQEIKVKAGDKLYIMVKAQGSQEINQMFSMQSSTSSNLNINSTQNSVYGYTVNSEGDIDFPVVGKIHVEGLTRSEVEKKVKDEVSKQVHNVTVTCTFMNLHFSVLGDIKNPGRFSIDRDNVTILEAISMAGDLLITGKRVNVMVLRNDNGKQNIYSLDLTDAEALVNSPVYYIKQGDVVYVEPNNMKKRQSTVNGNNVYSTAFWISVTSLLTSVLVLFKNW